MSSPALVLILPLISASIVFFLRRWPRVAGLVGAFTLLILALTLTQVNPDAAAQSQVGGIISGNSWLLLGRELAMTAAVRSILLFVYWVVLVVFLLTLILPQGSIFVPLSLAVLSPLAGALMVRPLVFGAVLLLVSAGIFAIIIQGNRAGSTLAAFRYLSMIAIAVPLLLIAGWIIETDQTPLMGTVAMLYLVAFVILLAGFPFQIWVAPLITESQPFVPAVILGVAQLMMVAFCVILLIAAPSAQESSQFWRVIRFSGAITLILAGLFSLAARTFSRLLGYLLLIDIGVVVIAFSFMDRSGPSLIMSLMVARVIGLIVAGMGFGYLRFQLKPEGGGLDLASMTTRLARKAPVGLALFVYGGMSLIGMPFTPGFRGHLLTVDLASSESFWLAVVMVLSITAGVIALLRLSTKALRSESGDGIPYRATSKAMRWAGAVVLLIALLLASYPQLMSDVAQRMAQLF